MQKKILFVALIWIIFAVAVFALYLLREVSPVKEFIAWALTVWPLLATLGGVALIISGWVIGHDFGHIKSVIQELRSLSIYDGIPIDATNLLYDLREKLAVGMSEYEASAIERPILLHLVSRKIVQLKQRRKASGDEGYWIPTELGNDVIRYLETNKQVLDKEGSQT